MYNDHLNKEQPTEQVIDSNSEWKTKTTRDKQTPLWIDITIDTPKFPTQRNWSLNNLSMKNTKPIQQLAQ
jgi:hypothetical protein